MRLAEDGAELAGAAVAGAVVVGVGMPVAAKAVEAGRGDFVDALDVGGHAGAGDDEHVDGVAVVDGVDAFGEVAEEAGDGVEGGAGGVGVGEEDLDVEAVVFGGGTGAECEGGVHIGVGGALDVVEGVEGVVEGIAGAAKGVGLERLGIAVADGGEAAVLVVGDFLVWGVLGSVWRLLGLVWRLGGDAGLVTGNGHAAAGVWFGGFGLVVCGVIIVIGELLLLFYSWGKCVVVVCKA